MASRRRRTGTGVEVAGKLLASLSAGAATSIAWASLR
jgi:hypothetical protein